MMTTVDAVPTPLSQMTPLTLCDRCDRCGAQAYVRAIMATGSELLFCLHHYRRYGDRLNEQGAFIVDESDSLYESEKMFKGGSE